MPSPPSLPALAPILARLEAQLGAQPGAGRLTREDILVLAILATEREATASWTLHRPTCSMHEPIRYQRRCTCGLELAESRSAALRRRLLPAPEVDEYDPRRRGKRGQER